METTKLDPAVETALRTMHDIVVPPAVSWLPQTWGWAAILTILLLFLCSWAVFAARRYRHNAYRRQALHELETAALAARDETRRDGALLLLASLLKRTALAAWPRDRVAALSRDAFVGFLNDSAKGPQANHLANLLNDAEYRNAPSQAAASSGDCGRVFEEARGWIERHHVST
ncbi:DUF4381 family protein [Rhizobium pusense]|uniref:DUF4381 domain-containing protein n=1 Tax=Agrobacterium pusense TaxID=648995 RepID=UPI00129A1A72|nr:DUF4381 domain-containing protein [Agrobacterium pusense]MRG65967.1 DUF4381 family protein [Agrobacterium pusense]